MSVKTGIKKSSSKNLKTLATEPVGNYEKHPFFVKKVTAAKALLKKSGLPSKAARKSAAISK